MSPHDMAGPLDPSSPNLGDKCRLARPIKLPNIVALPQEVYEIPLRKFVLPGKCSG